LTKKGICVFADTTVGYQDMLDGSIQEKDETVGSADMDLRMDLEKMGLWRGGFIRLIDI
jgi:hypothetical protein